MNSRLLATLAVALAVSTGCSDDDSSGPSTDQLSGTWTVTKAEMVSVASANTKVDLIALGAAMTVTMTAARTFSITATFPGEPPETFGGTYTSTTDVLTMVFTSGDLSGDWQFAMSLSGNTLTLNGANAEFDFDDNGADDPARLNLVLVRQ